MAVVYSNRKDWLTDWMTVLTTTTEETASGYLITYHSVVLPLLERAAIPKGRGGEIGVTVPILVGHSPAFQYHDEDDLEFLAVEEATTAISL